MPASPSQINTVVPPINPAIAKKVAERLVSGDKRKKMQRLAKSPDGASPSEQSKYINVNDKSSEIQYTLVR